MRAPQKSAAASPPRSLAVAAAGLWLLAAPATGVAESPQASDAGPENATHEAAAHEAAAHEAAAHEAAVHEAAAHEAAAHEVAASEAANEAEAEAEAERPRSGWAALPVASYSPETELGIGAFGARFFRFGGEPISTRPSSLAAVALFTTREQVITEFIPELYWDEERYRVWTKIDYRVFPNSVWGVGNQLPDRQRERYQERGPRLQSQVRRRIVDGVFAEVRLEAQHMSISRVETGGLLDRANLPGSQGGFAIGVGLGLLWDTRNHLLVPSRGGFYELTLMRFAPLLGSDFGFSQFVVNLRRFMALPFGHVLATQLYLEGSLGETPFYRLAVVGGQRMLRGYFEGRFRDRYLAAAQVEYRLPLFWRIGGVAFAAVGDVAPSFGAFSDLRLKVSAGAGLRMVLNRAEQLNLRADLGISPEGPGVYIGIAEAF